LEKINPNINNLPFQVSWDKNKIFKYNNIKDIKKIILNSMKNTKKSWKEDFLFNIRNID
jgi:hypothetical protein